MRDIPTTSEAIMGFINSVSAVVSEPLAKVNEHIEFVGKFESSILNKLDRTRSLDDQARDATADDTTLTKNVRRRYIDYATKSFIRERRKQLADKIFQEALDGLTAALEKENKLLNSHFVALLPDPLFRGNMCGQEDCLLAKSTKAYQQLLRTYQHIQQQAIKASKANNEITRLFSDHV